MPQTHALIEALKRLLKARAVTYAELAQRIGVSEASVKRMFSQKQFTLQRLDQILVAIGSDFQQLALAVQTAQAAPTLITGLTYAQENYRRHPLVRGGRVRPEPAPTGADRRLHDISEAQAVKYLLRLDKIGFLELLPNNRVKLLVARTFAWITKRPHPHVFQKRKRMATI